MARPRTKFKRSEKLSTPATEQEVRDFRATCAKLGMEPAQMLRMLVLALNAHAEQNKSLSLPIRFAREDADGESE